MKSEQLRFRCKVRPNLITFTEGSDGRLYMETRARHNGTEVATLVEVDRADFANRMRAWLA